jgi:O-antigen polysaccharide polymerase Wzy
MLRASQLVVHDHFFQGSDSRLQSSWFTLIVAGAYLLGVLTLWSEQSWLLAYFYAAAYTVISYAFVRTMRVWRDPFNPLCLVLAVAFFRFVLPGVLFLSGLEPEEIRFIQALRLSDRDWLLGNTLALVGLLGVILGWLSIQVCWTRGQQIEFLLTDGVKYAAFAGMTVGLVALAMFVGSNASPDVIASGEFRKTTIQPGTGKFFYLAYFLIAGSVLSSYCLLAKKRGWYSLVPVLVAALFYSVLGGRNRAMTPVAGGLLLLWYYRREQNSWRKLSIKPRYFVLIPVMITFAVWLSWVGLLYRGEFGVRAFAEAMSLTAFWEHVRFTVFGDLGQLHTLAAAIAIGPGVLHGQTFVGALSWPLGMFLSISGKSAGIFIVETLVGFGDGDKWGLNASLIGDAYLNFGLVGVIIVMLIFGALIKTLYVMFRSGRLHSAIYVIAVLSFVHMSWVSVDTWPQALSTLSAITFLILLGKTLFRLRRPGP